MEISKEKNNKRGTIHDNGYPQHNYNISRLHLPRARLRHWGHDKEMEGGMRVEERGRKNINDNLAPASLPLLPVGILVELLVSKAVTVVSTVIPNSSLQWLLGYGTGAPTTATTAIPGLSPFRVGLIVSVSFALPT